MRYKTAIVDKLISVSNGLKQLRGQMERGERQEYRANTERIEEIIEQHSSTIGFVDVRACINKAVKEVLEKAASKFPDEFVRLKEAIINTTL